MSVGISEEAKEIWNKICADDALNWVGLGYGDSKQDLEVVGSGNGGLEEAREICAKDIIYFGIRVYGTKFDGSEKRTKFCTIVYVPPEVSGLKKARVSMHKGAVFKGIFKFFHVTIEANSKNQLANTEIQSRLNNACGSHKPDVWNFGSTLGGEETKVEEKVEEEPQPQEEAPVEEEQPADE